MSEAHFELRPVPPYRLDLTVWALRRRPANRVDRWTEGVYRRTLAIGEGVVEIAVEQSGTIDAPRLRVTADRALVAAEQREVRRAVEWILGVRVDLSGFYEAAARHGKLGPLVERFRGVKPPRFPTFFEAAVNAIAFQQLSIYAGVALLNRLTEKYGRRDGLPDPAFARAEDIGSFEAPALRALGFSEAKSRALGELARVAADDHLDFGTLAPMDNETARQRLMRLRGIGPWSAEYILLRGLGRIDLFPTHDAGAGNRLLRWLELPGPLEGPAMRQALARFDPYAGMVYFHLLLLGLAEAGLIGERESRVESEGSWGTGAPCTSDRLHATS